MKDLSDNAQAYDDFMNSENDTFIDRLENEKDTLAGAQKKMAAAAEASVQDTRQNLIPLSRQYMTLAAAQADIANIPVGSTTYYRSPDDNALAIEVVNNNGVLEPTGRKMPSQQAVDDMVEYAYVRTASQLAYVGGDTEKSFELIGDSGWSLGTIGAWAVGFISS
ncbi:hypothetical protein ACPEF8_25245, partial [Klebsiella sp. K796]